MIRPSRRTRVVTAVALLIIALAVAGGLWAKGLVDEAKSGKRQAQAGVRSLASEDATAAVAQFTAAARSFASAKRALGPEWSASAVENIPWVGRQYATARTLADIGRSGSAAGIQLGEVLQKASVVPTTTDPAGRFGALIANEHAKFETALASLADVADRAAALTADGLVFPLAREVGSLKAAMAEAGPFLGRSRSLLRLESFLLSEDRRILVVSQNGAELRPTGGFAGSFGVIDVGPRGVRLERYQDIYAIRNPPESIPSPRGMTWTNHLSIRNANWWIDFPTSARRMLDLWRISGQPEVDGVVVVDTVAMQELLAVIGPVTVPAYGETFTSSNLLERLTYLVEVKHFNDGSNGKGVLVALAMEVEKRVLGASPSVMARSTLALAKAADAKHVQMYFTDPRAEATADALGWSGRVAPPEGTTDVVAVSNGMTTGSKVNMAMRKTIDYEVALEQDRSADTTLSLGYSNTGPYPVSVGQTAFSDWLSVYRATSTVFPRTTPSGKQTETMTDFGFAAEVRAFSVRRGESITQTLTARVPNALRADATSTTAVSGGAGRYRLYVVRQADLQDVPTAITVKAPAGWRVTSASARLVASGERLRVRIAHDRAMLSLPLRGDLVFDVRVVPF